MDKTQTWAALIGLMSATAMMFGFTWRLVTQSLDARFGELGARLDIRFEQIDSRFAQTGSRFDQINSRFEQIDSRFDQMDEKLDLKFTLLDHKIDFRFDALDQKTDAVGHRTSLLEEDVRAITRHLFDGPEAA